MERDDEGKSRCRCAHTKGEAAGEKRKKCKENRMNIDTPDKSGV